MVSFVGAGCGAADLITVRGMKVLSIPFVVVCLTLAIRN